METILDPTGRTFIPVSAMHNTNGVGAPAYNDNREAMFRAARHVALTNDPAVPRVSLTTTDDTSTSKAQIDAQWLFYEQYSHLTPCQFAGALAIRLNILPSHMKHVLSAKCNCGKVYVDDETFIEHVLACDQSCRTTHTHRHDMVRDSIIQTLRAFGVTTSKEPTSIVYSDGTKKRPDLLSHTTPCNIAADVTMIHSAGSLAEAEKAKMKKHSEASGNANAIFYPIALHTRGTLGPKAEAFIKATARAMAPHQQYAFMRRMKHSISTAAARGRADTLNSAAERHNGA